MFKRIDHGIIHALLLIGMLTLLFRFHTVKAGGTVYIRADGSIDPPTAPIQREGALYTLTGNIASNADGIVVEKDNILIDGANYTLQGAGAALSKGIDLSGRSNVTIKNMKIKAFTCGIWLYESSKNVISGNSITLNNWGGIELWSSNYTNIVGNNITSNNDLGIELWTPSCYVSLFGNNITNNNKYGIHLDLSTNNQIISGNTIIANAYTGIEILRSSDNKFYHNNFIGNPEQIRIETLGSTNVWDDGYPSGGNYWSDYTGVDLYSGLYQNETGSDGIGDIPYIMDANNRDNYPLMKAYPWATHDVGITSVTTPKSIVEQGHNVSINVMIFNYGKGAETINITTYANTTAIGQINNIHVASRNFTIVILIWNTTGVTLGNYTIKAVATTVLSETDTTDNTFIDGTVKLIKSPVAHFTYLPTAPLTGETITFNASLSTPDGETIISYKWNFGDGTPNATGIITTHSYTDNGTYAVTLTVTDDDGLTDADSQNITVLNRPPIAVFTENATTVYTSEVIQFNALASYDLDGIIVSYFWDFGDRTNATGAIVNHSYTDNGTYTVTLTLTDNDGESASTSAVKTVLSRPDIGVTNVTSSKTIVGQGFLAKIYANVTNQGGVTETFDVAIYANITIIQTQTITLTSGNSTIVTFTWDTSGFVKGNYIIRAYAWPLPGETDTLDNTFDSWVVITIPGDVTGDIWVDMLDISIMIEKFMFTPSDPGWDPICDVNGDNSIDMADISIAMGNFMKPP